MDRLHVKDLNISRGPAMNATVPVPYPQALRGAAGLFAATVAVTAFWLGLNLALPGLQGTGIPSTVVRVLIHTTMLGGLWFAIARTDLDAAARLRLWLAIAVPFTLWLALIWWLAVDGAFRPRP